MRARGETVLTLHRDILLYITSLVERSQNNIGGKRAFLAAGCTDELPDGGQFILAALSGASSPTSVSKN